MSTVELNSEKLQKGNTFMAHNFIEEETFEADRVVYKLDIRPESCNLYGRVHGGAIYAMADNAAGFAAHTDGRSYVTQSSSLNFVTNQTEGTLRAEGKVLHRGHSTCLVEVQVTGDQGKLIATGQFNFFCIDPSRMKRNPNEG